ncbi:hypothetical protein G7Z17_g6373 [Cylindrodendrum hubeiense]|uniref:Asl1-like glycosyl hydrolase catalytic domain-containing protein n=1 Tax=Cylindrodendrum hubeiense TaxID=595255 RepID=A0A9P5H965_9HYPO|nr:hypothetical protein G7Z17_g6373 [Cylindrodendrum hubeiense]
MVANKVVLLTAAATLVESALGFNLHRHGHQHLDKRAMETEWVTEWVTVCVTAGQEEAAAAATSTSTKAAVASEKNKAVDGGSDVVSTTTSTTIVVVPTSTSVAYVAPTSTSVAYVAPVAQTTLTTAIQAKSTVEEAAVYTTSSAEEAVVAVPETTSEAAVVEEVAATTTKAAAATTTTKKAATTSTTSSSSSAGISHKRGIAYNDAALANTFGDDCPNCGWAYGWSAWEQSSGSATLDSLTFIPLLHSGDDYYTSDWNIAAAAAIKAGSPALFSFNEPDIVTQADMSVSDAVTGHVTWLNPFAGQALIGAPSVSNSGKAGKGLEYLEQWIDACAALDEPCHYDFCNVHWYNEFTVIDDLFNQLEAAHKLCGKPIWLTEFALTLESGYTDAQKVTFLEEVIPKLEALDYLDGYAYWMVSTDNLMTSSTSLSTYGQVYAST